MSAGTKILGIGSLGVIAAGVLDVFTRHAPDIVGVVAKTEKSTAILSIGNQGNRAATIIGVRIRQIIHDDKCQRYDLESELEGDSLRRVLLPGEMYVVSGTTSPSTTLPHTFIPEVFTGETPADNLKDFENCSAVLIYIDHKRDHKKAVIPFLCTSANQSCFNANSVPMDRSEVQS